MKTKFVNLKNWLYDWFYMPKELLCLLTIAWLSGYAVALAAWNFMVPIVLIYVPTIVNALLYK